VHIFGIFFFLFFIFSLFSSARRGRVGHVEGQDPQGYVVLRLLFCCLERLPAIRIRRMAIASFPNLSHTVDINPESGADSDRTISLELLVVTALS
jgi:hypothetical protein